MAVLKRAFDWRLIEGVLENVSRHAEEIKRSSREGRSCAFPSHYLWVQPSLACEFTALDPETAGASDDFNRTTLHNAVFTSPAAEVIHGEIGEEAGYALVRARTILAQSERNGALVLHKESTAIAFPGVHVIWTALLPPGIAANREAPGIEFEHGGARVRPQLLSGDLVIFNGECRMERTFRRARRIGAWGATFGYFLGPK
jgi:hypothetical protein